MPRLPAIKVPSARNEQRMQILRMKDRIKTLQNRCEGHCAEIAKLHERLRITREDHRFDLIELGKLRVQVVQAMKTLA